MDGIYRYKRASLLILVSKKTITLIWHLLLLSCLRLWMSPLRVWIDMLMVCVSWLSLNWFGDLEVNILKCECIYVIVINTTPCVAYRAANVVLAFKFLRTRLSTDTLRLGCYYDVLTCPSWSPFKKHTAWFHFKGCQGYCTNDVRNIRLSLTHLFDYYCQADAAISISVQVIYSDTTFDAKQSSTKATFLLLSLTVFQVIFFLLWMTYSH